MWPDSMVPLAPFITHESSFEQVASTSLLESGLHVVSIARKTSTTLVLVYPRNFRVLLRRAFIL